MFKEFKNEQGLVMKSPTVGKYPALLGATVWKELLLELWLLDSFNEFGFIK
jgi:hypothetical protein